MSYDAIIFDSDGVLVEPTNPTVHRNAVRKAFIEFGLLDVDADVVDQLVEITGDERDELSASTVRRICADVDIDPDTFWRRRELIAAEAQCEEINQGRKRTYPDIGVVHTLDTPPWDLSLGVISNNQHRTLTHALETFHLTDHFDAIYGRQPTLEGLERRKPNTYYAEQVLEDFDAERPLLIGDSAVDIQTADRLGIDSVFLHRDHRESYGLTESPDYEIEGLEELLEVVR